MGKRIAPGDKLPFFQYDTPYSAANSFRRLLAERSPLVLVFMSNFGHPVTRIFVSRYSHTRHELTGGGFAMVVRSHPEKLAANIGPGTLPFPLLCDADGVLYDYLEIPQNSSTLMTYSLEGWRILREAKKQGYRAAKGAPQQLPLTLILDRDGTVLFSHYGASLTDVPEDCAAMQSLLEELDLTPDVPDIEPEAFQQISSRRESRPDYSTPSQDLPQRRSHHGRRRPVPTDDFMPVEPIREYGSPDLAKTSVVSLFDDPYDDD